ncbi:hypothetical protein WR25_25549 [Diploscapter pachys]|uniref:Uncharacterized protein n=1 Tax=Diploscapter pachys TaxID=2018661 RepID=A0A2A2M1Y3_9BILA|nr:hypothetical protein WR25_25549 [Diploscapter pachys]
MIEIRLHDVTHSKPLHQAAAGDIVLHGDRNDARSAGLLPSIDQARLRGFQRIALATIIGFEPPADLHLARDRQARTRRLRAAHADRPAVGAALDQPATGAGRREERLLAIEGLIILLTRAQRPEIAHRIRIIAKPMEQRAILLAPRPQSQPLGLDHAPSSRAACAA